MNEAEEQLSGAVDVSGLVDVMPGTELWYIWGEIAIEQAMLARTARAEWVRRRDAGEVHDLTSETKPSMVALAAAVTSIDGFERRVNATDIVVPPPRPNQKRHEYVWATLRAGFEVDRFAGTWPKRIKEMYALRNSTAGGLLHPTTVFRPAEEHPSGALDGGVSLSRAAFVTETVDRNVAFMREVYGTCFESVRPGLPELESLIRFVSHGVLKKLSVPDAGYLAWGLGGPDDQSREPPRYPR